MPVPELKRQYYGSRLDVPERIDVDLLASASDDEVRAHPHRIIKECLPGGGWALGSGNSLTNTIPLPNFLAMLDDKDLPGSF